MKRTVRFNESTITDLEAKYVKDALMNGNLSGDGSYTKKVYRQFYERFGIENMLLTTSGTDALELAALLANLEPGDEVITPSYTFSSTANAFLLRRAKAVFCDIREDNLNMDENKIEELITPKTKAIFTVDYAGVPCDYDVINEIAEQYNLIVVEDAAQAVGSTYKGRWAGTLTDIGCYSFHATKNYSMGEGGATVLNTPGQLERAEIIREKGTNRTQLLQGLVDKYTWHEIGSSFLPSDILAALLAAQMDRFDEIMDVRMSAWNQYHETLAELEKLNLLRRLVVPDYAEHNAHMYCIVLPSADIRTKLIDDLQEDDISAYMHYVPLHSSPLGLKLGNKPEDCPLTEDLAARSLRLPMHACLSAEDVAYVCERIALRLGA